MEHKRQYTYEEGLQIDYEIGAFYYMECSEKTGTNVEQAFRYAIMAALLKSCKEKNLFKSISIFEQTNLPAFQIKMTQFNYLNTPKNILERLDSESASRRYLACEKLLFLKEFAYENKIL